ncbi:MAG: hypothetical protein ABII06_17450, partial [Pseudomonadota bacterium]
IPLYHTYQQRAYGAEAAIMVKQIMDAEIIYYLENNKFFPDNTTIIIAHGDDPADEDITRVKEALNITIPVGHFLDYTLIVDNNDPDDAFFQLIIDVTQGKDFPLFAGGVSPGKIVVQLKKDGRIYPIKTW